MGREGIEPTRCRGHEIYSLADLLSRLPTHESSRRESNSNMWSCNPHGGHRSGTNTPYPRRRTLLLYIARPQHFRFFHSQIFWISEGRGFVLEEIKWQTLCTSFQPLHDFDLIIFFRDNCTHLVYRGKTPRHGRGGIRTHGPLSRHRRFQVYAVMTTSVPVLNADTRTRT